MVFGFVKFFTKFNLVFVSNKKKMEFKREMFVFYIKYIKIFYKHINCSVFFFENFFRLCILGFFRFLSSSTPRECGLPSVFSFGAAKKEYAVGDTARNRESSRTSFTSLP